MKKIYWLFILLVNYSLAQNFPYLNASTGNAGQSFTDADSNIYMYHGNRLAKLSKNLTPIWVKTYSYITLKSVLLSKTGSLYIIGDNARMGKLDAAGNVVWVKMINTSTITTSSGNYTLTNMDGKQLQLDHNNNLVVTGTGSYGSGSPYDVAFFMKLDTSGTILKTRLFKHPSTSTYGMFNVINDSAGNYKIYGTVMILSGLASFVVNYSEALDSINHSYGAPAFSGNYLPTYSFYKSKFGSNFYLGITQTSNSGYSSTSFWKMSPRKYLWSYNWANWASNNYFDELAEDEKGNLLVMSVGYPYGGYNKGFIGVDSNGVYNGVNAKYIVNYPYNPPNIPSSQLHSLYNGNYFWDATGYGFSSNPLTVGSTTMGCAAPMPTGTLSATSGTVPNSTFNSPVTYAVAAVTTPVYTTSATAISNFSVAANFCTVMADKENNKDVDSSLDAYPNPTNGFLTVSSSENNNVAIYDVNCGLVYESKGISKEQQIDISKFPPGIYLLKSGTMVKKIVKE